MKCLNNVFTGIFFSIGFLCQINQYCLAQLPELNWAKQVVGAQGFSVAGSTMEFYSIAGTAWDSAVFLEPNGYQIFQTSYIRGLTIHDRDHTGSLNWFGGIDVGVSWISDTQLHITKDSAFSYFAGKVLTFTNWDVDPGPESILFSLYDDVVIAKFSFSGEIIWVKAIGDNIGTPQEPLDIAVDSDGNVYTCGRFEGAPDFDPGPDTLIIADVGAGSGFIHKMNSDGELMWAGRIGEVGSAQGLVIDSLDNVYVTGYYQDTVDIAPGPDTLIMGGVTGNLEGYVIKLNPDGLTEWVTGIGGSGGEIANSIALSPNGDIMVSGTFNDTVNSYPQLLNEPLQTAGDYDIFIWKLDMDGGSIEAHRIGGPVIDGGYAIVNPTTKIKTDALGNVYLRGTINHGNPLFNIDMDPGPDTTWSQDLGITHEFIAKYDPDMNLIWAMPGNGAADFAVGSGQELYITGSFTDTIDLDPGPVQQLYISEGGSDMYVVKLNQDSLLTTNGEKGLPDRMGGESGLAVGVYPNPSAGSFTVELDDVSSEQRGLRYEMTDLAGRVVQTNAVQSSRFNVEFAGEPGVYLLRLWNGDESAVVRLVKK